MSGLRNYRDLGLFGCLSIVALFVTLTMEAPAHALCRQQVIDDAKSWVNAGVIYCQGNNTCPPCNDLYFDPLRGGSYRPDCSGFVSATWDLGAPGTNTNGLCALATQIPFNQLQPGDAVIECNEHVMLFAGWAGGSLFNAYEEYACGEPASATQHDINALGAAGYIAIRLPGIQDSCCAPQCSGKVCGAADGCGGACQLGSGCCTPIWSCSNRGCHHDDGCGHDCGDVAYGCELDEEAYLQGALFDPAATSDLDGDGKADVCEREAGGLLCQYSSGAGFGSEVTLVDLGDPAFASTSAFPTIRTVDVTGDGKADVCGRDASGFHCWPSTGHGFGPRIDAAPLDDASDPTFAATIRMADVDGDGRADVCYRSHAGIDCWLATASGPWKKIVGPLLSDGAGWNAPERYGTIRMGDVNGDGKADVCGRSAGGFDCWLSDGSGFAEYFPGPRWSDGSWNDPVYYTTIRMGDVNGDGKADVCARTATGFSCWMAGASGYGAEIAIAVSTNAGLDGYPHFTSIHLADINGDGKADLCARSAQGIDCWPSTGTGFGALIPGPLLVDPAQWDDARHYRTVRFGDVDGDGREDVCARSAAGVDCWLSTGTGFELYVAGPRWDDATSSEPSDYATLQLAGVARRPGSSDDAGAPAPDARTSGNDGCTCTTSARPQTPPTAAFLLVLLFQLARKRRQERP